MRHTKLALSLMAAALLASCGGSTGGDQTLRVKFNSMVSFGDSLSDVGTYAVGSIKLARGGKFTINGDLTAKDLALTGKNWTELMAAQLGLPAPCPAQTGLDGDPLKGFSVPVVHHLNCLSYAQGGARVTHPVGPEHKLTGSSLGLLTVPVVTQVATHLARSGGKFSGTEVVFVTAGGNDVLALLDQLGAGASAAGQAAAAAEGAKVGAQTFISTLVGLLASGAATPQAAAQAIGAAVGAEAQRPGNTTQTIVGVAIGAAALEPGNAAVAQSAVYGPIVVKAQSAAQAAGAAAGATAGAAAGAAYAAAHAPSLVLAMGTAGAELAAIVRDQIVAKGANYVVVNNLPDLGGAPVSKAQDATTQALINTMISTFNSQLKTGLAAQAKVLYVDLWSVSHDQINNPAPYGLTNTSTPACGPNLLQGASLVCNGSNLIAGDVSHYMFADAVLPTPFENALIAKYVAEKMLIKGWL